MYGMEINVSVVQICLEIIVQLVQPQGHGIHQLSNAYVMHPKPYGMVKVANVRQDFLVIAVLHVQPQDIGIQH